MLKSGYLEIIIITFSLIFSFWLMFHTFSDSQGTMQIATKAWSDFSSHIPLIKSFSFGENFPPQYPLFAGPPIHYHFLFYLLVGTLEKVGLRIDWSLNIPSALGFASLLIIIYYFTKKIFNSQAAALLSVIFFLFNGTLSFLYFLRDHPLSLNFFQEIINNQKFPSFGPYDEGLVAAFWNLNIYTNQRHLALAYALSLIIILVLLRPILKQSKPNLGVSILLGITLGLSFFFHLAVLLMTIVVLISLTILFPRLFKQTFIVLGLAAILILPQYLYLQSGGSGFKLSLVPGYLAASNLNLINLLSYWFANLGFHLFLIPLGIWVAPPLSRKILISFLPVFIIGNLFQFSPEMAGNHKFFNYFMILGVMFSAYFLVYLWKTHYLLKPLVIIWILVLTFSGIIDFFPVLNDGKMQIADYPKDPDVAWIIHNTSPQAVFLNTSYIFDKASLAGRKIFMGWPYFAWSAGYDTDTRGQVQKQLLGSQDITTACQLLVRNNLDYLELSPGAASDPNIPPISPLFVQQFQPIYRNPISDYIIYSIEENCP